MILCRYFANLQNLNGLCQRFCEFANLTAYADDFLCCEVNFQRDKPSGYRTENLQTHKKARLISI